MNSIFTTGNTRDILARLSAANQAYARVYPGESPDRQPVHTVYGGAHLFSASMARKLGAAALRALRENAGDFAVFARALDLPGADTLPADSAGSAELAAHLERHPDAARSANRAAWLAHTIYSRVVAKLEKEAVEDHRIDFEDGYGNRPDDQEDAEAVRCGAEMATGLAQGALPPFTGIRIKPFNEELRARSMRTLDLFLAALVGQSGGRLPDNFVITLPKVTIPEQVSAFVDLLELLETTHRLAPGSLRLELMVEMPQSILGADGRIALPGLVAAARGRCRGAHFGTYDYTAGCNLVAAYQLPDHPACDFARHVMQVSLAGSGVMLSDGATAVLPVGPHRAAEGKPLTPQQLEENAAVVRHGWRIHFRDVQRSLRHGFYQGWDLNPAQFPSRYAAVFAFFLDGLESSSLRLKSFMDKAAQATLLGNVFDDAATGQGLLNSFLRGMSCGALTVEEALGTGLTVEEFRSRSFVKILKGRAIA